MARAIIVVDFSCIKYKTYFSGQKYWSPMMHGYKTSVLDYWRKIIAEVFSQISEAVAKDSGDPNPIIVGVADAKRYWRTSVFAYQQSLRAEPLCFKIKGQEAPDIRYKGNRLSKSTYSDFLNLVDGLMWELKYRVFKADWAEADDLFGAFAKAIQEHPNLQVYGASLDRDWMLCCAHPRVKFLNLHHKKWLEIMDSEAALKAFQKEYKNVASLDEVPEAKSRKGERSDNLPKGFDPRLADLVNYALPPASDFADLFELFPEWNFNDINTEIKNFVNTWGIKQ